MCYPSVLKDAEDYHFTLECKKNLHTAAIKSSQKEHTYLLDLELDKGTGGSCQSNCFSRGHALPLGTIKVLLQ